VEPVALPPIPPRALLPDPAIERLKAEGARKRIDARGARSYDPLQREDRPDR
jgi:hypothetical protein